MNKFVDMTGEIHGGRTVLSFSHQNPKSRNLYWNVRCNTCGHEKVVMGSRLRKGHGCGSCAAVKSGRKGLYSQAKGKPVYFIRCGDYFKIGSSDNIERRLKDMQTSNPYELELIGVDEDEEFWHRVFKHRHYRGEWYHCELVDIGSNP